MLEIEWEEGFAGQVQVMDFDVMVSAEHTSPAEITEHAVETGVAITDHVRAGNDTATIEAWATDTPLEARRFAMDGATFDVRAVPLPGGGSATLSQLSQQIFRVRQIDETLRRLRTAGQLLTVRTPRREMTNVVIERYTMHNDVETGKALGVTLELRTIRIATTERVSAPRPRQRRGQRTQNRGNQPTTPPAPPDRERYRSIAASLLRQVPGFGGN